jgi:hypothetical protein
LRIAEEVDPNGTSFKLAGCSVYCKAGAEDELAQVAVFRCISSETCIFATLLS